VLHLKVAGKGEKTRYLPLHPGTNELIHDYLEAAGHGEDDNGALFRPRKNNRTGRLEKALSPDAIYKIVRRYSADLGFEIGAHALRATAATNALDHQADIAKVQEWLGHANIAAARRPGGNMAQSRAILAAIGWLVALAFAPPCEARVVRFVVEQPRSFAGGMSFGDVGPYQRLDGTAYMEVDPRDPLNAVIVNLDKAPRNATGLVEFTAPFFILKPADMSRGDHKILYGINNRDNKQTLGYFNYVPAGPGINDPLTAADAGDGFLMRLG
jgi:hypothetical protein